MSRQVPELSELSTMQDTRGQLYRAVRNGMSWQYPARS